MLNQILSTAELFSICRVFMQSRFAFSNSLKSELLSFLKDYSHSSNMIYYTEGLQFFSSFPYTVYVVVWPNEKNKPT